MQRGHGVDTQRSDMFTYQEGCSERAFTPVPTRVGCNVSSALVTGIRAGLLTLLADACDTALNGARAHAKLG